MNSFNMRYSVCLVLVFAMVQVDATPRRKLIKRSPGGYDTPATTPMPMPMPMTTPAPMPMPMPDPMPMPMPPAADCECPNQFVIPSINNLLANLNPSLGDALFSLLGDNALVTAINDAIVQLLFQLTGCPITAAMGMGQGGVVDALTGVLGL